MAGIEDSSVIDLVAVDSATGEYAVIMTELRPWGSVPEQLDQLIEKINTYAAFVLDVGFTSKFPVALGRKIRIQIDCTGPPDHATAAVIEMAATRLADYSIGVTVNEFDP
jgi:hypothetical protein